MPAGPRSLIRHRRRRALLRELFGRPVAISLRYARGTPSFRVRSKPYLLTSFARVVVVREALLLGNAGRRRPEHVVAAAQSDRVVAARASGDARHERDDRNDEEPRQSHFDLREQDTDWEPECEPLSRQLPHGYACGLPSFPRVPSRCVSETLHIAGGRLGMESEDPIIGASLSGFVIDKRIGEGGMGRVYSAHHERGTKAAIKVLRGLLAYDEQSVRRFRAETEIIRAIDDPAVVRVFAADVLPDGRPYIVMEHLAGSPLDQVIFPITLADVIELLEETARAVAVVHRHGVLHRDLKPSNIHVARDNGGAFRVTLIDFGLALERGGGRGITVPGVAVGTPAFMSPEQAQAMALDFRSDAYAFGCVAHWLLTGHAPYRGTDSWDVLRKHVREAIPYVRDERPDVPRDLAELVRRCLAKSPDGRPASMELVADELHAIGESLRPMPQAQRALEEA
jgi:predicted Ser/Thr protein kinase